MKASNSQHVDTIPIVKQFITHKRKQIGGEENSNIRTFYIDISHPDNIQDSEIYTENEDMLVSSTRSIHRDSIKVLKSIFVKKEENGTYSINNKRSGCNLILFRHSTELDKKIKSLQCELLFRLHLLIEQIKNIEEQCNIIKNICYCAYNCVLQNGPSQNNGTLYILMNLFTKLKMGPPIAVQDFLSNNFMYDCDLYYDFLQKVKNHLIIGDGINSQWRYNSPDIEVLCIQLKNQTYELRHNSVNEFLRQQQPNMTKDSIKREVSKIFKMDLQNLLETDYAHKKIHENDNISKSQELDNFNRFLLLRVIQRLENDRSIISTDYKLLLDPSYVQAFFMTHEEIIQKETGHTQYTII